MEDYLGAYLHHFAFLGVVCFGYIAMKVVKKIIGLALRTVKRSFAVDLTKYGRWAVITGSTDGIGKSYALQMAEKGMDIVLISRNPQKLAKVAEEIRQRSKAEVKVIVADFKRSDIYEHIRQELNGLDIGILVNNVGMKWPMGYYCDVEDLEQVTADIINVNILSCVMMTNIVLPQMLERKRGIHINLGSGAGLRPIPMGNIYAATKVFIRFFTDALNLEYSSHGVTFQLVAPNMVETNMTKDTADMTDSEWFRKYCFPSSDEFVKKAIQTIGKEAVTCPHWSHVVEQFLWVLLPDSVLRQLMSQQSQQMAEFEKKKTQ